MPMADPWWPRLGILPVTINPPFEMVKGGHRVARVRHIPRPLPKLYASATKIPPVGAVVVAEGAPPALIMGWLRGRMVTFGAVDSAKKRDPFELIVHLRATYF